ncbi:MAG: GYF domain-containing protein [Balneolaceae bacterium]
MKVWYWHKENDTEPRGPISERELKELAKNGDLSKDDKIWKEGFDDWVIAASVSDIFTIPPPIKTKTVKPPEFTDGKKDLSKSNEPAKDKNEEKNYSTNTVKENSENRLTGVGGWLTFFCIALTIIGPLVGISQLYNSWEEIEPAFDLFPILESAMWLETLTIIGIMIYGFFIGIMIWSGNENGKIMAEKYLKIRLSAFIIVELLILLMVSGDAFLRSIMIEEVIIAVLAELLFFGVWFSYFKKSKRVANTYAT